MLTTAANALVNQKKLKASVARAERKLAPDVVRIRYSLEEDWMGEPAVFFRILLSDDASREDRLGETVPRVERLLADEVEPHQYGLRHYFSERSVSEQAALKEESWV
jgi:hypothetical protein